MRKMQILSIVLTLFCAAALTACGTDPITADSSVAETTAVTDITETTAEDETATTAEAETTTAASETDAAATTAETDAAETTVTVAETTAEQTQAAATEAPATQAPQQTEAPATEAPKQEQHLFDALKIGESSADYRASHTDYTKRESDSCLVGKDYEYTYPDFVLIANENNGVEKIKEIRLTGAGVSTREGIHIGSSEEDVVKAYGAGNGSGAFTHTSADGKLEIFTTNGVVDEIILSKE